MNDLLSLTWAVRLVGVSRVVLQKKIQCGEMASFDGMVSTDSLLSCYPDAQLEDTVELKRISQIKERAFGKWVFERAMPDAEVLAARVTDLSKELAISLSQLKKLNVLLDKLWKRLDASGCNAESREAMENLK